MWILALFAGGCVPHSVGGQGDSGDVDAGTDGGTDSAIDDLSGLDSTLLPAGDSPCREPVLVTVDWVVDGDTAYVNGPDGDEKIRFIGVNTPEVAYESDPADCYGDEAHDFTVDTLEGQNVWLSFDGDCLDDYDRTLAYINTGVGEQDLFERVLLLGGWARTMSIAPNTTFQSMFEDDERAAEDDGVGGWGACGW